MTQTPGPFPPNEAGRRRSPRVDVHGQLTLTTGLAPSALTVINVSSGGFLIHSRQPLAVGDAHDCQFSTPDGAWSTSLRARVVYTLTLSPPEERPPEYASGFAFVETEDETVERRIRELLDRILGGTALRW